jgi:hypothetical protein
MLLARGNKKEGISEGQGARGFPAVSLLDVKPALTRLAQGRLEGEGTRGKLKVSKGEQIRRGRTSSIFRLWYRIDNYTCYIGNCAPSLKCETNQYYQQEHAWGAGIHV